jgi:hypothetical protein
MAPNPCHFLKMTLNQAMVLMGRPCDAFASGLKNGPQLELQSQQAPDATQSSLNIIHCGKPAQLMS